MKDVPEGLELPYWDPRYNPGDRNHIMPIITPAYPPQNSTFNVTQSNLKIIQKEVELGVCVSVCVCVLMKHIGTYVHTYVSTHTCVHTYTHTHTGYCA